MSKNYGFDRGIISRQISDRLTELQSRSPSEQEYPGPHNDIYGRHETAADNSTLERLVPSRRELLAEKIGSISITGRKAKKNEAEERLAEVREFVADSIDRQVHLVELPDGRNIPVRLEPDYASPKLGDSNLGKGKGPVRTNTLRPISRKEKRAAHKLELKMDKIQASRAKASWLTGSYDLEEATDHTLSKSEQRHLRQIGRLRIKLEKKALKAQTKFNSISKGEDGIRSKIANKLK